jgi:hypothetical protein
MSFATVGLASAPASRRAPRFNWPLYRRWVLANGWSECVGLSATGVLGVVVMRLTGEPSSVVAIWERHCSPSAGGMLFEGILVGSAKRAYFARATPISDRAIGSRTAIGAESPGCWGWFRARPALAGPSAAGSAARLARWTRPIPARRGDGAGARADPRHSADVRPPPVRPRG